MPTAECASGVRQRPLGTLPHLRKDAATIQSMFGVIAPRYDLLNHLLSFNVDKRWRKRTVALAEPRGPVLDVCTGTGDLAATFHKSANRPVVGLDFCAPMLRQGKDKKKCRGVRFLRGDALSLPFPDNHFDVVAVGFGIRNVADLDRGLSELVRVARPGGRAGAGAGQGDAVGIRAGDLDVVGRIAVVLGAVQRVEQPCHAVETDGGAE